MNHQPCQSKVKLDGREKVKYDTTQSNRKIKKQKENYHNHNEGKEISLTHSKNHIAEHQAQII